MPKRERVRERECVFRSFIKCYPVLDYTRLYCFVFICVCLCVVAMFCSVMILYVALCFYIVPCKGLYNVQKCIEHMNITFV